MTDISNLRYLYNLQTGETVGINKDGQAPEGTEVNQNSTTINGEEWNLLGGQTVSEDVQYGTVEDLSFDKMVELFLQGNMTVEELEKGLKSKGVTNFQKQENNGTVTVTFDYQIQQQSSSRTYELTCSTESAKSQVETEKNSIITEDDALCLAGKYGMTVDLFNKYFTKVGDREYVGSIANYNTYTTTLYKINGGLSIEEIEAEMKNYTPPADGVFSEDVLYNYGFSSDYYINLYFDKDEDGNYKLKENCSYTNMSVEDIQNAFNANFNGDYATSIGLYKREWLYEMGFSDYYINMYFTANDGGYYDAILKKQEDIPSETTIGTIADLKNVLNLKSYDEYLNDYDGKSLDTLESERYATEMILGTNSGARGINEAYANKIFDYLSDDEKEIIRQTYSSAEGRYEWERAKNTANTCSTIFNNAIDKYKAELAQKYGKNADEITAEDIYKDLGYNLYDGYEDTNTNNSIALLNGYGSIDDFFAEVSGIWKDTRSYVSEKYLSSGSKYDLLDYVDNLEPELENPIVMEAVYKATGITDADSLDAKHRKLQDYIRNHRSLASIFEDIYTKGLIAEKAEDNPDPEPRDEEYYNNLDNVVIENFLDQVENIENEDDVVIEDLDQTDSGEFYTKANKDDLESEVPKWTEEEKQEKIEEVLDYLLENSTELYFAGKRSAKVPYPGNDTFNWLETLIRAMGGEVTESIIGTITNRAGDFPTGITFTLNGNTYTIVSQPGRGSIDENDVCEPEEIQELKDAGASDRVIELFFSSSSKNGVIYKAVFTRNHLLPDIKNYADLLDYIKDYGSDALMKEYNEALKNAE